MEASVPIQAQDPAIEYAAQAVSPLVKGDVRLTVGDNTLSVTSLYNAGEVFFTGINELILEDYAVVVKTDDGDHVFSRMGNWLQPFYDTLFEAYNKAVLRSMFIKGDPVLTAKGRYSFVEKSLNGGGRAALRVYGNSVAALPPDLSARRVPLCFVRGIAEGDFELTLELGTGERYTFAKLGYDTAPFADAVAKQIRALRDKSLAAVRELDPSITPVQASKIAGIIPQGAAASFGQLAGIAPSFTAALESKLITTRAAEYYAVFKELCDPAKIYIGFRKDQAGTDGEETTADTPDEYLLWLIAPSPDGRFAAVEFAEADAATFIYRTSGDFSDFAGQLNRALEAIDFKREVIRMTDEELRSPENADYYMAAKRTSALRFVRSRYAGRIIHSGIEAWRRKLIEAWNST